MIELSFERMREELKANGLVFVRNFISVDQAVEIKNEIEKSVQIDLNERKSANQIYGRFDGSAGVTHNNQGKHIITDYFGRSAKLDQAVGKIFEDENVSRLLKFIGGDHLKLRGYNTRRMNGPTDYSAMEWHRDNWGEFTIGIVLSESGKLNDSSTCYIPGSHLYPYCPFIEAQFTMPQPITVRPLRERLFSALLQKWTTAKALNASGQPGDMYIFLGDLWHGRRPNFANNNDIVFFVGLFPSEIPFPPHAAVNIPSAEVLGRLPPSLRRVVDFQETPANATKDSYFYQLQKQKKSIGSFSFWKIVQLEKKFWKETHQILLNLENRLLSIKNFGIRGVRKILRVLKLT